MKTIICLMVILACQYIYAGVPVAEYYFDGGSASSVDSDLDSTAGDWTIMGGIGALSSASGTAYVRDGQTEAGASGTTGNGTLADAITYSHYHSFTLSITNGSFDLSEIELIYRHDPASSSETGVQVLSSLTGFTENDSLGGVSVQSTAANKTVNIDLYSVEAFHNLSAASGSIEFRVYFLDSTDNWSTIHRVDSLVVKKMLPIEVSAGEDGFAFTNVATPIDGSLLVAPSEELGSLTWSKFEGAGEVSFDNPNTEDPNAFFDSPGEYKLQITAQTVSGETASDIVIFNIKDPADKDLYMHYNFETISSSDMTLYNVANNLFDATTAITEPNLAPGFITGSSVAIDTRDDTGTKTTWTVDNYATEDPNSVGLQFGFTASAWIQVPESGGGYYSRIIEINGFKLQINGKTIWTDGTNVSGLRHSRELTPDTWHNVVSVWDPFVGERKIYIDGLLGGEKPAAINDFFVGSGMAYVLGSSIENREFAGLVDDIRVYNYPMTAEEVASLTTEGDISLYIVPLEDADYLRGNLPFAIEATIIDDEKPQVATISWEQVSGDGIAAFLSPNSAATEVTFSQAGEYVLKITADNGVELVEQEVTITVTSPVCEDVIAAGLKMAADLNGDCYINIEDLAMMAIDWLSCNDPQNSDCLWAF